MKNLLPSQLNNTSFVLIFVFLAFCVGITTIDQQPISPSQTKKEITMDNDKEMDVRFYDNSKMNLLEGGITENK